jgi:uncharacterized OsmC-like protein
MTTVTVRSLEGFQTEILASGHRLLADEPLAAGGTNTGPNPYELLLGALGACKSMTVLMYARRKRWDLRSVTVELMHGREYDQDCKNCEEQDARIDRITVWLTLEGNLDDAQRQRLKEIANRCPVHRTLCGRLEVVEGETPGS